MTHTKTCRLLPRCIYHPSHVKLCMALFAKEAWTFIQLLQGGNNSHGQLGRHIGDYDTERVQYLKMLNEEYDKTPKATNFKALPKSTKSLDYWHDKHVLLENWFCDEGCLGKQYMIYPFQIITSFMIWCGSQDAEFCSCFMNLVGSFQGSREIIPQAL